ncbi:transposase [Aquimarina aggregata]|uniref:transposase n=1 Tax=Aquimarina aggregata TaxID=1642818 RepID=UPI0024922C01|nr:transposase [Aquimarina aggregata]
MYTVLDKDTIEMEIVPFIPKTKRGFPSTVLLVELINAILYKLKTGVQWNQLLVKALFEKNILSWNTVYYHYRKWCLSDALKDGSHTPAIRATVYTQIFIYI